MDWHKNSVQTFKVSRRCIFFIKHHHQDKIELSIKFALMKTQFTLKQTLTV